MEANVKPNCIGCGMCAGTCPGVFNMGSDGYAHGGEVSPALLQTAQVARDECPVSAIDINS